ncbi:MAG: hypothetical protein AAF684_12450 [Pseudomonadota bacterium]
MTESGDANRSDHAEDDGDTALAAALAARDAADQAVRDAALARWRGLDKSDDGDAEAA